MSGLERPRDGHVIAGVCSGTAHRFGWSVGLAFVVFCVLPGPQVLFYVFLWILTPNAP
ncbi:PspC domain-containing protein [Saccharopolyspora sp. NPDC002376]